MTGLLKDKLGRPLRTLRVSVTDRCNFRCFYCMPPDKEIEFLPREEILTYEEIERVVRILSDLGVEKVRITGGEPLVRKGVDKLICKLKDLSGIKDIALTTNGYRLKQMAKKLAQAGLNRITVSLNTLRHERFSFMSGGMSLDYVLEGIEAVREAGIKTIKVNSVIVRGINDDEILDLAEFCREKGLILRFIEYMDVGTLNGWTPQQVFTANEILERMASVYEFEPVLREVDETALRLRYRDIDLEFGIIASVTMPFCSTCTRLRLSADGTFYTCLFSDTGINIKELIRGGFDDRAIAEVIIELWQRREDRYSEIRLESINLHSTNRVEMFRIGG